MEFFILRRDKRSFVEVMDNASALGDTKSKERAVRRFTTIEENRSRFSKAFVGRIKIPGSAYNIQTQFEMEGFFAIKVTPLGGGLCLLEESEEGFIEDLIGDGESQWKIWFEDISRWNNKVVVKIRMVWVNIFGIPGLAWNAEFFKELSTRMETFIRVDEHTTNWDYFDIARIMIRIDIDVKIEKRLKVEINGKEFILILQEDSFYTLRINPGNYKNQINSLESSELDDHWSNDMQVEEENSMGDMSEDSIKDFSTDDILLKIEYGVDF